jgi:hypothetical protein
LVRGFSAAVTNVVSLLSLALPKPFTTGNRRTDSKPRDLCAKSGERRGRGCREADTADGRTTSGSCRALPQIHSDPDKQSSAITTSTMIAACGVCATRCSNRCQRAWREAVSGEREERAGKEAVCLVGWTFNSVGKRRRLYTDPHDRSRLA